MLFILKLIMALALQQLHTTVIQLILYLVY